MKAFIVDKYGKDSRLRAGQLPEPEIGDHDVLVRILASGVNPLDAKIMAGEFKLVLPYKPPFVLGNDLAGVVERWGPACNGSRRASRCTRVRTRTASAPSPS
jgi:NADPH:quinone reductase-like Zn-dependent oxidoreductase